VDIGIVGDAGQVIEALTAACKKQKGAWDAKKTAPWWKQIAEWRKKESLRYVQSGKAIKPQYAIDRLYQMTKGKDVYITTEVGQHQMWAAQYFKFSEPNRFMTSGGLGTMGYGLPAAVGVQVAHPDSLVIDIAGEASIQMTMQEISTAVQFMLPVKAFIINNRWMGMVRQWQELIHGGRYSHSYSDSLPDFVKLAEAYGAKGLRAETVDDLDKVIKQMIAHDGPVLADIMVVQDENCFPMIPSGAAHNEMILGVDKEADKGKFTKDGLSRV
jgi:acetolactate synthase-1/2/3 large subunit